AGQALQRRRRPQLQLGQEPAQRLRLLAGLLERLAGLALLLAGDLALHLPADALRRQRLPLADLLLLRLLQAAAGLRGFLLAAEDVGGLPLQLLPQLLQLPRRLLLQALGFAPASLVLQALPGERLQPLLQPLLAVVQLLDAPAHLLLQRRQRLLGLRQVRLAVAD